MNIKPSYTRLFYFYIFSLLVLLMAHYGFSYLYLKDQQKQRSQAIFSQLSYELAESINRSESEYDINQILKKPFLKDASYQLVLIAPSGQTYIHDYYRLQGKSAPNIILPATTKNDGNEYHINYEKIAGWVTLDNNYKAYINLYHQPLVIDWLKPRYWAPLAITLLLIISGQVMMLRRRYAWQQLIDYAQSLSLYSKEAYQPPEFIKHNDNKEFLQIGHSLSRANYQLHKSHRRTQLLSSRIERLVEQAPLPIITIKHDGQISSFNARFTEVFATSFQHNVTYSLTDFVAGIDKRTHQALTKLSSERVSRTLLVTALDYKQTYQLHVMPWFGEHGQIHGFTAILSNITHLTQQLADGQNTLLKQQNRLADFDQLWSVMGHELRTPLSGMIGMIELVNRDNLSIEQQETLTTLEQTSQSMLSMLNGMLDMAKLDAGKLKVETEVVDVMALCEQTCELMAGNARRKGIDLYYFFDPKCSRYLTTDAARLRQILMNLLSNAIKFTQTGYVALIIEPITSKDNRFMSPNRNKKGSFANNKSDQPALNTNNNQYIANTQSINDCKKTVNDTAINHIHDDTSIKSGLNNHTNWLCFSIQDTGIGISPDEQKKLFSYFNQANDSISRQFGGTGLGLAISNNFAQLLGGFIHLNSTAGVGSTFSLSVPIHANKTNSSSTLKTDPKNKKSYSSVGHQPVYTLKTNLEHACLIAFVRHDIIAHYLRLLCNHLLIPAIIRSDLKTTTIDNINHQMNGLVAVNLSYVLLVDYELYQDNSKNGLTNTLPINESILQKINNFDGLPKILFSMMPERGIPPQITELFDGYLPKPLAITHLISEISRLSNTEFKVATAHTTPQYQEASGHSRSSNVQDSFSKFLSSVTSNNEKTSSTHYLEKDKNLVFEELKSTQHVSKNNSSPLVLVAEDNLVNQKVACKVLEKLGYRSTIANNGQEAIDLLSRKQSDTVQEDFALILMDCRMPIMDGITATKMIRSSGNNIPIIALTANDSEEDRNVCLQAGMNGFLSKPLKLNKLDEMLKHLIAH